MNGIVLEDVFGKLFCVPDDVLDETNIMMVNLNSLISPFFYKKLNEEIKKDANFFVLAQSVLNIFRAQMIERYSDKRVIFYYKDINKEYILRSLYTNWRIIKAKDDNSPFGLKIYEIFDNTLNELAKINQVSVIKTEFDEHTFIPRVFTKDTSENILIISRDPMDLSNAIHDNISIWNGRYHYSSKHVKRPDKNDLDIINISPIGIPWVLMIAGMPNKIGYSGIANFGLKKAIKYIMDNIDILAMSNEDIDTCSDIPENIKYIMKYKPCFFFKDYLKYKEEWLKNKEGTNN